MTREEAISGYIVPALKHTWNDKINNEVIKALEQEPCEDAISRQAVKELYYKNGYIDFHKIHDLPPVTPQPKTGHWIEDENEMKVWCSECGEENDNCSKHCPNCGAKMVKPQESEE